MFRFFFNVSKTSHRCTPRPHVQLSRAVKDGLKSSPGGLAALKAAKSRAEATAAAEDAWDEAMEEQAGCA